MMERYPKSGEANREIAYSIVIPCYQSGGIIEELVQRIEAVMRPVGECFELVLINDASPDNTWEVIESIAKSRSFVRGIDLLFNTGQFRALICGFEHARGQFIITMDDDLQHPPEEIPKLISAMKRQPHMDCMIGAYEKKEHSNIRNAGSSLMAWLNRIFYGKPRDLELTSFRIMKRQIAEAICAHRTVKPIIGPLILRSTRRIGNVRVAHMPRAAGKSGYGFIKLVRTTLDHIISVSTLPLQVVSAVGLLLAFASALLILYYLGAYLFGHISRVPGFRTLVLLVTFFGGMTMLSMGLLGEYLILILNQTSRPPRYFVRAKVGMPEPDESLRHAS